MTRSRASAKSAGSRHERSIADYLAAHVDDRIDRRVKTGNKDRGDIGGVRILRGGRMVLEAKDASYPCKCPGCGRIERRANLGTWYGEAELERGNDDAVCCAVVHKRRGKGQPGDQWVTMTLADLVALLTGERPREETE